MEWLYPVIYVVSLCLGLLFIRLLKGPMLRFGVGGIDINKPNRPKITEAGGMLLLPGIWILVLMLVQLEIINPIAYALLFTLTCFAAMGFFDDGFKLFKKERGWSRYLANRAVVSFVFTLPFAFLVLPPLFGWCPCSMWTYWYAVAGGILIMLAASLSNSFAGLNGWEVGSSVIVLAGLTVMAAFSESYTSTLIALCLIMLGAQMALFRFNRYPARVFPGDSGTLLIGSFIGCIVLFIDKWYLAACLFYPHVFDILLKLKTNRGDISQKREAPYAFDKNHKITIPKSGKLDFAKFIVKKLGPMDEKALVKRIHLIVLQNTLFWTLLYILFKII